jgi:hypothetical protein
VIPPDEAFQPLRNNGQKLRISYTVHYIKQQPVCEVRKPDPLFFVPFKQAGGYMKKVFSG